MKYKELPYDSLEGEYPLKELVSILEAILAEHPLARVRIGDDDFGYNGFHRFTDGMIKLFVPLSSDELTKMELKIQKLREQNADIDDKIRWYQQEKNKLGNEMTRIIEDIKELQ